MKLVAGLGNPGAKYEGTRHNVGFAAVDLLAKRHGLPWDTAPRGAGALIANWRAGGGGGGGGGEGGGGGGGALSPQSPLTFMNLSGQAVVPLLQFYKIELAD